MMTKLLTINPILLRFAISYVSRVISEIRMMILRSVVGRTDYRRRNWYCGNSSGKLTVPDRKRKLRRIGVWRQNNGRLLLRYRMYSDWLLDESRLLVIGWYRITWHDARIVVYPNAKVRKSWNSRQSSLRFTDNVTVQHITHVTSY